MKVRIQYLLLIAVSVAIAAPAPTYADCSKEFCAGVVLPLSRFGAFGQAFQNGIEIAQAEKSAGSQGLRFVIEDSGYDALKSISAVNHIVKNEKAQVIYVLGGTPSEVTAPLAKSLRIPILNSSNDPSTTINHPYTVRFANSANALGDRLGAEVLRRGFKHTAVVLTENPYHQSLLDGLEQATAGVVKIQTIHRGPSDTLDFRSIISRIRKSQFDSIGVLLHPGQTQKFYRQLAEQGVSLPTFSGDGLESLDEVKASGPAIEGAFFVNHGVSESFRKEYVRKFGSDDLISFAAWGHDLAVILETQFGRSAVPRDADEVMRRLSEKRSYEGASGTIEFVSDEAGDRYFRFPLKIREVVSGGVRNRSQ